MKKNFIAAGLLLAFVTAGTIRFAESQTPVVRERQENQQERRAQGVKSSELTAKETKHLEAREVKIQQDKKEAKGDAVVTNKKRARLHREQNLASRAIHR